MILLTKLDGTSVVVNDEQILYAEANPDTTLVLSGGSRLMVKEPLNLVVERSAEYRRRAQAEPHVPTLTPPKEG
jgi:flagellar protein FlbD